MRPGGTRFLLLQEGGPYDGLYTRNGMRLETFSYGYGDDETSIPYAPICCSIRLRPWPRARWVPTPLLC